MSNRSGSPYSAPRDANHVPLLVAASTADGVTPVVLEANPTTHGLAVTTGTLLSVAYDYLSVAYPDGVTEVYTYKTGGSGGTTVATVTMVYTDSTKASISTITKV
jgi:hypothetical protein